MADAAEKPKRPKQSHFEPTPEQVQRCVEEIARSAGWASLAEMRAACSCIPLRRTQAARKP